jgi:hypothetical protein
LKDAIGPLKENDGNLTNDTRRIADILNKQYQSAFSNPLINKIVENPNVFFIANNHEVETLSDFIFGESDIVKAIGQINNFSTAGPDGWSAILIKNCKTELAKPIYLMWRKSLDTGKIPQCLKAANIAPIYKGGDRSEAKNYRPVALTSHLIKIFERIIRERINMFLEATGKLNKQQHGFRTGRSCLSQLLEHYDNIIEALEEQSNIDVIYTDFAKAFDKCDHGVIAHKLVNVGIVGKLGIWIFNFLSGRTQSVLVDGMDSKVLSKHPLYFLY